MREDFLLSSAGSSPVTREVRRAMDAPVVSHRSAEFEAIYERAQDGLDHALERSSSSPRGERTSAVHTVNGYGR